MLREVARNIPPGSRCSDFTERGQQQVQPSYQQGGLKQPSSLDAALNIVNEAHLNTPLHWTGWSHLLRRVMWWSWARLYLLLTAVTAQ